MQDDSTFTNPLLAFAMGERNNEDSRRKSLAVAAGMKRRASAGKATGGPRPYGYRYADDGSGLIIVPAEAEVVRRLFADAAGGKPLKRIALELDAEAVRTARGGRWR